MVFGKKLNLLWPKFHSFGQIFIVLNGLIITNNSHLVRLVLWSQYFSGTLFNFYADLANFEDARVFKRKHGIYGRTTRLQVHRGSESGRPPLPWRRPGSLANRPRRAWQMSGANNIKEGNWPSRLVLSCPKTRSKDNTTEHIDDR